MHHIVRFAIGGLILFLLITFATSQIKKHTQKEYPTKGIGVEFTYPKNYFYEEREIQDGNVVVLTEDSEENRLMRESTSTVAGEGPVAITIARYDNPEKLELEPWLRVAPQSNFSVSNSIPIPETVGKESGLRYSWSGLYEGESIAVQKDDSIFLFSVTYLTEEDVIRSDFEKILKTISFK